VWTVLAEPERFAEWWPGVEAVDPGRRGLVPGGLWRIDGGRAKASFRRKPEMSGNLLLIEVVPRSKVVFQLMAEGVWVELELEPNEDGDAAATLVVEAPRFSGVGRAFPSETLAQLAALVRPPAETE
jgi:uncharacterized protein YndB with AHSA1/START domain